MRLVVGDDSVEVLLSPWQKLLGLMRDIRVARGAVGDIHVVEDPMRETMSSGIKVGLRLPWLYYVARTIRLDEAFIVRRGVPALSFSVADATPLRRVLVSTPHAHELAARLTGDDPR
ncbi:MAG TPA: hypothetical protein VGN08_02970 [Solirubrobacteraceae bacterium]|jgi:hypothetical protein